MPSRAPLVSVVLCVVDPHPVYFPLAVRSVLEQSLSDLELIVVEEPSSARAAPLLAAFSDTRIRHHENPVRTSLVAQRNRGIELARAELIAVMDSDDIAEPTRLEKQVAYMRAHPEVGAVGTQLQLIDPDGRTLGYRRYPTEPEAVTRALSRYNPIGQPAVVYRKSVAERVGGYGEHEPVVEDYDLWCRMALAGTQIANLDEALVRYRIHPGGMKTTKLRETLQATIDTKERHFRERMNVGDRLRLLGERILLHVPPQVVMRLFLATSLERSPKMRGVEP